MPSHADRVRRNYHNIKICETKDVQNNAHVIQVIITRLDIASKMSVREVEYEVWRLVQKGIIEQYV